MHRSKKPSSQRIWSAWGDWIWSQTQNRYYSQRQDTYGITPLFLLITDCPSCPACRLTRSSTGEIETRWGPVYDSVPRRRDEGQEDLVGAIQGIQLGDGEDGEYQDDRPYSVSSPLYSSSHRRGPRMVRTNEYTASYPHSQPTHGGQHAASYSKSSSKRDDKKRRDRKGKGKSYQDSEDEDHDAAYLDPDDDAAEPTQGSASI